MHGPNFQNTVLRALPPDVRQRLQLHPVRFELFHEIEFPGRPIQHLVFVEEGMASMTTTFEDGCQVEIGMFGHESIIGVSGLMGTRRSLNRIYTQIEGHGFSSPIEHARREFALGGQFHCLCLRYVQAQLVTAGQSAACNVKHHLEQRLARWLLLCADRAHTHSFKITHEFLADMLGSSRPTVTSAAVALKAKGLIDYTRGVVSILDSPGLERQSCECYQVIKDHLDNYIEFDSGLVA